MIQKITIHIVLLTVFFSNLYSQNDSNKCDKNIDFYSEVDVPILVLTGGIAANAGINYKNYRMSIGYEQFNAPSKEFSGTPDGFKMRVDYIYAINFDYVFSKNKEENGAYTRIMYHNKKQYVENIATHDYKNLYSQLVGLEVGYIWKFYKGFYLAPRVGAMYYIKKPQGKENNPVLIGDVFYDNKRHKILDTYYSFMLGYTNSF